MTEQHQPVSPEPSALPARRSAAERFAGVFTGLVKLGGLVIAVNEALFQDEAQPAAFAIAAFMMAGAQGLDTFLSNFFGNK